MKKIKLLIADDSEDYCRQFKLHEKLKNIDITAAFNGKTALNLIDRLSPDIIIIDDIMPGPKCTEILKQIYSMNLPHKPKIIVTLSYHSDDFIKCAALFGVSLFIPKNSGIDSIIAKIITFADFPNESNTNIVP